MLKKILGTACVAMALATLNASAIIDVQYVGADGFLRSDDTNGLLSPGGSGNTALVQLIFTTVNAYDVATAGGGVGVNETVVDELLLTEGSNTDEYGGINATGYTQAFTPGYLYVRVFDQGTGLGGSGVIGGTWYYDSPIYATIDNNTGVPDILGVQGNNTSPTYGFGDTLNLQVVVPEPATFALMGLGGLALAIRRRFTA